MEENGTMAAEQATGEAVAVSAAPQQKKKRHISQQKLQDNLWGWAFCIPLIVGTVLFVYTALVLAIILSFGDYQVLNGESMWQYLGKMLSGKANVEDPFYWYKFAFCENRWGTPGWSELYGNGYTDWVTGEVSNVGTRMNALGATLFNTVFYMIGIPIGMVLSMFFAVCMSRDIKGGNVFRVLYYIPSVASTVAIVYTFQLLFSTNGLINKMFGSTTPWLMKDAMGGDYIMGSNSGEIDPFWTQGLISKFVIIIMSVWKGLGGTIILYVAGLSGVNAATKEAASIDGANAWVSFWKVTMPDLYPVIFYNVVTSVIGGMQIYAEPELFFGYNSGVNIMTSGYVSLIWYYGIIGDSTITSGANVSIGAAYGMILAIIIFILTLFQFWLDGRNKD